MKNKMFETNQELENYLLSLEFKDVTEKYEPHRPSRKCFEKKKVFIEFENINISITHGCGVVYSAPSVSKSKLDSLLTIKS